jgi:capsular exopolysaccharide synthesis family protein
VLLSSTNRPPRTIAIISNEAGVGKTTISVNMAIALAQAGKRVLLIDADMRRPGCAQALGTDNTAGLSTHLSFEAKPVAIDHDCAVPGLDLLPSGPVPPNPSELLSSEKVHALIESMAAQYEHVIIDTPPVALVSDALILAAVVDGVILVVRSGQTSRRGILRVKDSLRTVNARILGVALNAINLSRHQYRYESRYGYGYDYSHGRRSKKVEEYHRA